MNRIELKTKRIKRRRKGIRKTVGGNYIDVLIVPYFRTAVRDNDVDGIARTAHALTGASLNVGAEPMAAASRELRALVDSGTTEGASALATQLDDLFLAVKAALEARIEKDHRDNVVSA